MTARRMIGVHEQGNDVSTHATPPRTIQPHLTPRGFAAREGIDVRTCANWRSQGKGPAYIKVGGLVRYPLAAVEAWERENTVGPVSRSEDAQRDVGRILRGPRRADS